MTRFAAFAALYVVALYLDPAKEWQQPGFTVVLLLLGVLLLVVGLTRRTVALYLAVATGYPLLTRFPDVANHVNLEIYCSVLLLVAIGYARWRSEALATDDDCLELARPVLQLSAILIYVLAGFAKLNTDFLNPEVSCVAGMLDELAAIATRRTFGVPRLLLAAAGVGLGVVALLSARRGAQAVPLRVRVAVFGLILLPAVPAAALAPSVPVGALAPVVVVMAVVVILWEVAGGLLLAVPRCQGPLVAFSWTMHAVLALIGFIHFGAFAVALLFTFVPASYMDLVATRVRLPLVGRSIPRPHLYLAINLLAGILSGLGRRGQVAALIFDLSTLFLVWPILRALATQLPRPAWPGVSLRRGRTPLWLYGFPGLLLLHGLTSYVGLRTAGNFTMFSNLRTEGARSNHLLLGANPLKAWGYQEDVVRFRAIDDSLAAFGDRYQTLPGRELPVVEFRKWIQAWTEAGTVIPMTFEYRGRVHSTENIATDPQWRASGRNWEMWLMDFRVIQPEGPNQCRW